MLQKISHDGKFTIIFPKAEDNVQPVTLKAETEVSVWEVAHAIYIDCVCEPQIDAYTLTCKLETPTNKLDVTVSTDFSIQKTLSKICDIVKV